MLVPLFTKRHTMGIAAPPRRTSQTLLYSQPRWGTFATTVLSGSQSSEDKVREEVRGHVAALMRSDAKYMQEKVTRESLEAQAAYNATLVIGLEEKLDLADKRLHNTQLDLENAQDALTQEKAKRRTLEFSYEALASKYDALTTVHSTLDEDHNALTETLMRSKDKESRNPTHRNIVDDSTPNFK
ncbi:hypothetical protein NM688_g8918 [Phlebia brevispora]|uniref:Uncharacterized protein n=1 Tax=Phlebia brevispora TaxID=194682 RepID=A0ACC1RP16_9APHY|nr:hypothetical protein NM688_g8918 [Phlebia brevispora]